MLDPIEITMEAVKTFSDPHYDNAAKNLFLYPEILAPILANVVPEYQGMNAEQVKKLGDMDGMCRYINMRKNNVHIRTSSYLSYPSVSYLWQS